MISTIRAVASLTSTLRCGETSTGANHTSSRGQTGSGSQLPPLVYEVLSTPGHPLDPATRNFFEHHFRCDFSRVRVHIDACSTASAHLMNTLAYTSGTHIVFGGGQYMPWLPEGKKLLAHELTHVLQQGQPAPLPLECLPMANAGDAFEQEADKCAQMIITPAAYPHRELHIRHKTKSPVLQGWYINKDDRAPTVHWQTHELITKYVLSKPPFASWIHEIFKDLLILGVGKPDQEKANLEALARGLGKSVKTAQETVACLYHAWGGPDCTGDVIDRHIDRYIHNAAYYFVRNISPCENLSYIDFCFQHELGRALHAAQDKGAHLNSETAIIAEIRKQNKKSKKPRSEKVTPQDKDDPDLNKRGWASAFENTRQVLRHFRKLLDPYPESLYLLRTGLPRIRR